MRSRCYLTRRGQNTLKFPETNYAFIKCLGIWASASSDFLSKLDMADWQRKEYREKCPSSRSNILNATSLNNNVPDSQIKILVKIEEIP